MPQPGHVAAGLIRHLLFRGGEDSLTEVLAVLLRNPDLARAFLAKVVGTPLDEDAAIEVATQVRDPETGARPDLVLKTDRMTIWVEAKLDAGLTEKQPAGYVEVLSRCELAPGRLVFLVGSTRWSEVAAAIQVRLGLPVQFGAICIHRGVAIQVATWAEVKEAFEGISLQEPVTRYLLAEFVSHIDHHVERGRFPLTPEMIPMLTSTETLAAIAALEDLLMDLKDHLSARGFKVRNQDGGDLRQTGFKAWPEGTREREIWVGMVVRAGIKWPGRGPIWAWLYGDAFDQVAEARLRVAGFEVLDPEDHLPDWGGCGLVPLPLPPHDQVRLLAEKIERLFDAG